MCTGVSQPGRERRVLAEPWDLNAFLPTDGTRDVFRTTASFLLAAPAVTWWPTGLPTVSPHQLTQPPPSVKGGARGPGVLRTHPGLSLSIQRPPHLLLKQGVGPLQGLVLPGQLAEPQVGLFSRRRLNVPEKRDTTGRVTW